MKMGQPDQSVSPHHSRRRLILMRGVRGQARRTAGRAESGGSRSRLRLPSMGDTFALHLLPIAVPSLSLEGDPHGRRHARARHQRARDAWLQRGHWRRHAGGRVPQVRPEAVGHGLIASAVPATRSGLPAGLRYMAAGDLRVDAQVVQRAREDRHGDGAAWLQFAGGRV
jgi:hypothetical protein